MNGKNTDSNFKMCLVFSTSFAVVFEKGEDYNSVASFYSVRKGTHHIDSYILPFSKGNKNK